ncbi:helix-turn-helix domain-containing protein [Lachnoclostridium phytofermentans]|nr:helix-turn-helix domain-containing protein [Lachnoclostridium phytofermentans]
MKAKSKRRYWDGRYGKRILAGFLWASIIPVLILGIISYFTSLKSVSERMNNSNHSELIQTMLRVDSVLETIEQHYVNIVSSEEVKRLVENEVGYQDYSILSDFMNKMITKVSFINYINGYSLINFDTGWIYSNSGMKKMNDITNAEEINHIFEQDSSSIFWINNTYQDWSAKEPSVDLTYLSLAYRLPLVLNDKNAMIVININRNAFETLMENNKRVASMIILDQNGEKVYGNNAKIDDVMIGYIKENVENSDVKEDIIELSYRQENEVYQISLKQSDSSGWTYIAYYNTDLAREDARSILYIALWLALGLFLLIICISSLWTYRIYQPIKKTYSKVKDCLEGEAQNKENELEYIEQGIHTLYHHNVELEDMVQKQRDQLIELFVLRLLRGQLTEEMITANMQLLKIQPEECFSVILMNCSLNEEGRELSHLEKDVLHIRIAKSTPDSVRAKLMMSPVNNLYDVVMVVGGKDEKELEEKIMEICKEMSEFVLVNFSHYTKVGISRTFDNLTIFPNAFREATEALKMEGQSNDNQNMEQLTYYSDMVLSEEKVNTYNLVLQNRIKDAVDKCDERTAFHVVEEFLEEIKASESKWNEQYYFLYRFLLSILVTGADAGLSLNSIFEFKSYTIFQQFHQLYTLKEMEDYYKYQLVRPMIEHLKDFRKNSRSAILEKIELLVLETEGDITLTECAEKIECHANTIWRIMKDMRDQTFSEFVAEIRLEKAKDLLVHSTLSVAEIAEKLNYTNAQNFIRYFKKHCGVTPGKYRQEKKE